jgi:hypothetical protein
MPTTYGTFSDLEVKAILEFVRLRDRTGDRKLRFEIEETGFSVWYAEPICMSELYPLYRVVWH